MIDPANHHAIMKDTRLYQASTTLFKLGLILWNRLRIRGAENVPDRGGVLIASNHASYLDPPAISAGYRRRPVYFMARDTLWKSGFSSWWMSHVGCIPVSRSTGDIRALKLMIKFLKEGKVVSIFPEGTRSEDGNLKKAKDGVGFIIEKSKCTVVPAYVGGSHAAFPRGGKWIKPRKVTVTFGRPITQDDFQALGSGRSTYEAYAALIMQRIANLRQE